MTWEVNCHIFAEDSRVKSDRYLKFRHFWGYKIETLNKQGCVVRVVCIKKKHNPPPFFFQSDIQSLP